MSIDDSFLYSIKDSSVLSGIPSRTLSRIAKSDNGRKIDGRYLFTGYQLKELMKKRDEKIQHLAKRSRQKNSEATFSEVGEVQIVEENERLKLEIKELRKELSQYDIADNERLEIFTEEMYLTFEKRLIEWREQNEKIKTQQELFNAKEKGLNDVVEIMTEQSEHYKNQFEYQKEQSTRILDMHEQLIKTIQQNNYIEAKSKGFDKK
jgi:hypothetical protein|tara:strand:- start:248 stop:868 length:621 start_codon:yes stop_codon:yes gene_type:complete